MRGKKAKWIRKYCRRVLMVGSDPIIEWYQQKKKRLKKHNPNCAISSVYRQYCNALKRKVAER